MIALMIVCVASAFGGVVLAPFTPIKHRWAWALLSLVGAGTFAFNWTTGQAHVALLNLRLFDAAFMKGGPAAPWIQKVAFPVGAMLTVRHVRNVRRAPAPALEEQRPAPNEAIET